MTNNFDPAYGQPPSGVRLPPPPAATQPDDPDVEVARRALALEKEGTEKAQWGVALGALGLVLVIWGLASHHTGIVPPAGAAFCVGVYMIFQGGKLATEAEELADQISDAPPSAPLVSDTSDFVTLADGRVVSREHAEGLARADAARVREGYQPIHDQSQSPRPDSTPRRSDFDDLSDEGGF